MKILVTGASGFLGSWICRVLSANHEVIALLRDGSDQYRLGGIDNLKIVHSDDWVNSITRLKPEVVIINDWWGVGNTHRNDPKQFENLIRFESTVDAAIKAEVKVIIGVGSQAELGPVSGVITESQADNPTTEYGRAKAAAHKLLKDKTSNSDIRSIWFRVFSTYGALDSGGWLITDTIDSLLNDKEIPLTQGEQIWSYLHAYDLANSLNYIIKENQISGTVNIGNPQVTTIKEVVSEIGAILEKSHLLKFGEVPYRKDQVMELRPACEKLTSIGWSPVVTLYAGLKHTLEWMQGKATNLEIKDSLALKLKLPNRIK